MNAALHNERRTTQIRSIVLSGLITTGLVTLLGAEAPAKAQSIPAGGTSIPTGGTTIPTTSGNTFPNLSGNQRIPSPAAPYNSAGMNGNIGIFGSANNGYPFGNGYFYRGYSDVFDPFNSVWGYGGVVINPYLYGYGQYTYPQTTFDGMNTLRSAYAQGYRDAAAQAGAAANQQQSIQEQAVAPDVPTGMSADPRPNVPTRVPHGEDRVKAWRVGNQLVLRWIGDPNTVSRVTFALTDRSGRTLRRTSTATLPAEVRFSPSASTAFYELTVQYIDGGVNTIMSRLPRQ